jgi:type I restriction enzyme M protein
MKSTSITTLINKMSEKRTETYLAKTLQSGNFEPNCIYYSPTENNALKHIFSQASKSGSKNGIPDRLYFDGRILIVFECKTNSLHQAFRDLVCYKEKMIDYSNYDVFFVSVIPGTYDIYDLNLMKLDLILDIKCFKDTKEDEAYTNQQMDKDIHRIHNYIRDYTKISNEDKSFFIACILISLTKNSFIEVISNYDTKKYIYDILKQNLLDFEIDISVFEFLRNDQNNRHFYNIIMMVKSIYDKNPEKDLLNNFYKEFVKYSNTDGKSLGIVLTPDHIVKLMIEMLDIQPTDTVLDLCTGTGSFLLEASKYKPKQLIGCEYQTKLYSLLKCNFILRGLDLRTNPLIKGDCFENEFKATKSVINPPYGMKDKKELDFIIKQLESVEDGGLVCAIIPTTSINNTKFIERKSSILDVATPLIIINCNPKLFYPSAGIQCSIILLRKHPYKDERILFINYEKDGFCIEKHRGLVKSSEYSSIYERILHIIRTKDETDISVLSKVSVKDDWNYHMFNKTINFSISSGELLDKMISLDNIEKRLSTDATVMTSFERSGLFPISDIFDIQSAKRVTLKYAQEHPGNVPYVSASALNNGITAMTNISTHPKNCLTIANSGSVGVCFYHTYDICATDSVYILRPKQAFNHISTNKKIMLTLALLIEKNKVKYSFGRACRLNKICDDFFSLPIDHRGYPDFSKITCSS